MISRTSRFNRSKLIRVLDKFGNPVRRPYLYLYPRLQEVNYPDNQEYRVTENDTWPSMAHRFYGDSGLWWILCEFNRIVDPIKDLRTLATQGALIIVPSRNRVFFDVLAFTNDAQGTRVK